MAGDTAAPSNGYSNAPSSAVGVPTRSPAGSFILNVPKLNGAGGEREIGALAKGGEMFRWYACVDVGGVFAGNAKFGISCAGGGSLRMHAVSLNSLEGGNIRTEPRKASCRGADSTSNPNHLPLLYFDRVLLKSSVLKDSSPNLLSSASLRRAHGRSYSKHATSAVASVERSSLLMSSFPSPPSYLHSSPAPLPCRKPPLPPPGQSTAYPAPSLSYSSHRPTRKGSVPERGCMLVLPVRGCVLVEVTCETSR